MKRWGITFLTAALITVAIAGCAQSEIPEAVGNENPAATYQQVNESLVANHVLPGYERLASSALALQHSVETLCASPMPESLAAARDAYQESLDSWMRVQHLQFGPVELFMRSHRLYFWPQGRGKIDEAIADLVTTNDRGALSPDRFHEASVAVQGLPAIEQLLFESSGALVTVDESASFRCQILMAAVSNVRAMAADIRHEWQQAKSGVPGSYASAVLRPDPEDPRFRTSKDATFAFFKSLHGGLQLIADVKLKPVVGKSIHTARPRLVESPASDRALRNIELNLEALEALYTGAGESGLSDLVRAYTVDGGLDPLMRKAFRLTRETAASIGEPLHHAVTDPSLRPRVEKLHTQVLALKQIVRTRVATALGLSVGFNALDGD